MSIPEKSRPLPSPRAIRVLFPGMFLVLMVLSGVFFPGCESGTPPPPLSEKEKPVTGGVFHRAFQAPINTLDPGEVNDSYSHEVCRQIYDGLVEFDAEGRVIPAIAASWTISPDRLTYTLRLRNDVRFHSHIGLEGSPTQNKGRTLTAEDVIYTFRRLLDPQKKGSRGKNFLVIQGAKDFSEGRSPSISGIKAIASDTVEFSLEKAFTPFLSLLALSNGFIVPREDAEPPNDLASRPVGTGPFTWGERTDSKITLLANPDHFRGRPYFDRLEYPHIPSESERFAAFKRGELDTVDVPDPEYMNVKQDPKWSPLFQEVSRWGIYYLGFNVKIPPFDNPKVRQAICYGIDRETITRLIVNDRAKPARGILPPGIMAFNPALRGYSFDIAKARALLSEAGYPGGKGFPEITLQYNRDPIHTRTLEFVLANLRDLGINCTPREVSFKEHLETVEGGQAGFFRMGWTVDYPDPDNFLHQLFHSSNAGTGGNFSHYSNPLVDDILDKARAELDTKERIALYQRAEQVILDDAPIVCVYHYTTHVLCQPYVRDLVITPMGPPFICLRKVWFGKK